MSPGVLWTALAENCLLLRVNVCTCAVFLLQLANTTQQSLDGFMVQFNKNSHGVAPASQVCLLIASGSPCKP